MRELLRERVDDPLRDELLFARDELLFARDDDPVERDEPLRDELLLRPDDDFRPPALCLAAACAALAADSKSFLIAVANLVESLRASERNLFKPLYRPWVPLAAPRPPCSRSSLSAFSASLIDLFRRLSAAGSLNEVRLLLRRDDDEERVDFRAWGIPVS